MVLDRQDGSHDIGDKAMRLLSIFILGILSMGPALADEEQERLDDREYQEYQEYQEHSDYSNRWKAREDRDDWEQYRQQLQQRAEEHRERRGGRRGGRKERDDEFRRDFVNSGVCDGLANASPGLRRLCVAFCEVQSCEADFTLENPLENCSPGSSRILARYEAKRGAGDPDMPCIQQPEVQTECPCWTRNELANLRYTANDSAMCFLNISNTSVTNYDSWQISNNPGSATTYFTALSSMENSSAGGPSVCSLADTCSDGNCTGLNRFLEVSPQQFAACEADLVMAAQNRGITCTDFR